MYLAPLNYNRFFQKVFSDSKIAKNFLEDFLDIEIDHIDVLKNRQSVTDDAAIVEFDFRCKINGQYIIIDMQQWYKIDIIQRFFLYHTLNTALQLETLPKVDLVIPGKTLKKLQAKNYKGLEPVITLIWMVHDTIKFKEDYIQYAMTPNAVIDFINNKPLWNNLDIVDLVKERENLLKVLGNTTKNLDFIYKNKLIFMFQKNIVQNKKMLTYKKWFDFAEKTRNKENTAEDFQEYSSDEIFSKMIKRLKRQLLSSDEMSYIKEEEEIESWVRLEDKVFDDGKEEGIKEGVKEGIKEGREKGKKEQSILTAKKLLLKKFPIDEISEITELSINEIQKLQEPENT